VATCGQRGRYGCCEMCNSQCEHAVHIAIGPRGMLATSRRVGHVDYCPCGHSRQRGSKRRGRLWPRVPRPRGHSQPCGYQTLGKFATCHMPCGKFFLFLLKKKNTHTHTHTHNIDILSFFPKYHENIKTTFEIYHKHKFKLRTSIILNPKQQ